MVYYWIQFLFLLIVLVTAIDIDYIAEKRSHARVRKAKFFTWHVTRMLFPCKYISYLKGYYCIISNQYFYQA